MSEYFKNQETKEREGVRKTSEQLQREVDKFLANGGKIETRNNLGEEIAKPKRSLEVNKIARGWVNGHYPHHIAKAKAKNAGIDFKVVNRERERIKARGKKS